MRQVRAVPEDILQSVGLGPEDTNINGNPLLSSRVLLSTGMVEGVEPPEEFEPDVLLKAKVHAIYAGTGQGKTWVALWLVKRAIERGETVLYFDNENGYRIISERLAELGVNPALVDDKLVYLAFPSLTMQQESRRHYAALIKELRPDLVIFDSWITFLGAAGMDENSANDIAKWCAVHTHQPRKQGATVVLLDHIPHDGSHARGSTRKKDEVDVQWSLRMTAHFDRETVGEISLLREKDREAWLPIAVKFSVGGTLDGFIFERSSGTIEDPEPDKHTIKEAIAIDVLRGFGLTGAKTKAWENACKGQLGHGHFYRVKRRLIADGTVVKDGRGYHHVAHNPDGGNGTYDGTYENTLPIDNTEGRSHEVPHRSHMQNGTGHKEVPSVPPPYKGGTDGTYWRDSVAEEANTAGDEVVSGSHEDLVGQVIHLLTETPAEYATGPKKALEQYQRNDTRLEYVVNAILNCWDVAYDDLQWRRAAEDAVEQLKREEE